MQVSSSDPWPVANPPSEDLPDDPRLLFFLQELVRTESTPGRERDAVALCVEEMRNLGYDRARIDASGNAVGQIGDGHPIIVIDCHIDTIPLHSLDRWTYNPLGAELVDGRIYGLGSCDMKGSAAAMIYGIARLAEDRAALTGTIYVVCSIAEEMMEGATLAQTFDGLSPDVAIIGEPTDLNLAIGQRGRAKLEAVVTGQACHAGHPGVGINAAERMAEFIGAVARLAHPVHPLLGPRSITCIDVHSEPYPSVSMVPATCTARFDCRFGPDDTLESLLDLLRQQGHVWDNLERPPTLDCHVYQAEFATFTRRLYRVPEFAPAWWTGSDAPLARAATAALQAIGIAAQSITYRFCTNGSLTAGLRGVPTIGFGVGREADAHTVDESISITDLYRCADGFAAIAQRLLKGIS